MESIAVDGDVIKWGSNNVVDDKHGPPNLIKNGKDENNGFLKVTVSNTIEEVLCIPSKIYT